MTDRDSLLPRGSARRRVAALLALVVASGSVLATSASPSPPPTLVDTATGELTLTKDAPMASVAVHVTLGGPPPPAALLNVSFQQTRAADGDHAVRDPRARWHRGGDRTVRRRRHRQRLRRQPAALPQGRPVRGRLHPGRGPGRSGCRAGDPDLDRPGGQPVPGGQGATRCDPHDRCRRAGARGGRHDALRVGGGRQPLTGCRAAVRRAVVHGHDARDRAVARALVSGSRPRRSDRGRIASRIPAAGAGGRRRRRSVSRRAGKLEPPSPSPSCR